MLCETIAVISDIVLALAAIVVATVAVRGLSTWRKELHGQADFALARRIMQIVYESRNRFRQIRNDLSVETWDTQYERLNGIFCELDVALLEAKVLWGDHLKSAKQTLKECVSTYHLARQKKYCIQEAKLEVSEEENNRIDAILYGDYDKSDDFGQAIECAIAEFESAICPYLNRGK